MDFEQTAKQRYEGADGRAYHETKRSIPDEAYPWVARLRAKKISPHVRPDDCVLEYGVGTGWNLAELHCKRKLGFDVSGHLEDILTAHGIEFIKDIKAVEDSSMDVVICHHALEHTPVPGDVLKEIASEHKLVLDDPPVKVHVDELADSSVNLFCRPWVKTENYWTVHWDLTRQVKERFDTEGISIPYPQRDVHMTPESVMTQSTEA